MKTYTFTLILAGVAEITPELADALYAATNGDVELNLRDGVAFLASVERRKAVLDHRDLVVMDVPVDGVLDEYALMALRRAPRECERSRYHEAAKSHTVRAVDVH